MEQSFRMEPLSRAEIESSVDSFPDLDYKFEHIDWADIMEAEEASNPEQKLEILQEKSFIIRSSPFINQTPVSLTAMPALTSLRLDDNSRGLPPLQLDQRNNKQPNGPNPPTSFSGVLNTLKPKSDYTPNNTSPGNSSAGGVFKVPAPPKQMGRLSLGGLKPLDAKDRKSSSLRPPPSPSSIHEKKRLKISNNSFSKDWDYVDDDFIFTTDTDITPTNYNSFRLPIPHSASVSTLESDTEIETSSAYSETSSTSTLTSKGAKRKEKLPTIEDPKKLDQRQKQIDYGKNTEGYINYLEMYPKCERTRDMPKTPDKTIGYSHRRWLGLLAKWRKSLHKYDMSSVPNNTSPKTERISIHIEDANTFPTLPLQQDLDAVSLKTETMDEEVATPFSYSSVLQNLHDKIDSSASPPLLKDNELEQNCVEPSVEKPQVTGANQPPVVSIEEESPIGCKTYSAVLKAPKPIRIAPIPTSSPDPTPIKETPKSDPTPEVQELKALDSVSEVKQSQVVSDIQVNIQPPFKPTYCQVLMAPKPPNPVTSPPPISADIKPVSPLPPEESPLPQDSESDDSMEVDVSPTPKIPAVESTVSAKEAESQPLTYSQALRSKPTPIILNANSTTENEHQLERRNEIKESMNANECRTEPCTIKEDIIIKVQEKDSKMKLCDDNPPEQTPPTYSQILSGIRSPQTNEPISDKEVETEPENASLDLEISKSVDIPPPTNPQPTSYRNVIPQNAVVSLQKHS